MKFLTVDDAQHFLCEVYGNTSACHKAVDNTYQPTNEELDTFMKSRSSISSTIKDSKKSSTQKFNWAKNRSKIMRGIKKFHKSIDGKRLHRKLGRFLATRITRDKNTDENFFSKNEHLSTLTSLKQHLLLPLGYYMPLLESVETEVMVFDYALPVISSIESRILENEELSDEENIFLLDMVNEKHFLDSLSEITGKSFHDLEKVSEGAKSLASSKFSVDNSEFHFEYLKNLKMEIRGK